MAKGSSFERWLCHRLSEWWTQDEPGGPRDDVFWRTAGSGARATARGKRGRKTANSHGDVCAIDPVGQPLIDVVVLELKCGYNRVTLHDLIDQLKPSKAKEKKGCWEGWIAKAERSCKEACVPHWAIIHKRDRREPVIVLPLELRDSLATQCGSPDAMDVSFRGDAGERPLVAMRLSGFLEWLEPGAFKFLAKREIKP